MELNIGINCNFSIIDKILLLFYYITCFYFYVYIYGKKSRTDRKLQSNGKHFLLFMLNISHIFRSTERRYTYLLLVYGLEMCHIQLKVKRLFKI